MCFERCRKFKVSSFWPNVCRIFVQFMQLSVLDQLNHSTKKKKKLYIHCKVDGWKLPLLMHLHAGHVTLALYPGSTPMSDTFSETHSPSILLQSSSSTACGCVLNNSSPSVRGRTQTSPQATDKQVRRHKNQGTVMLFHACVFLRNDGVTNNACTCVGVAGRR